MRDADRPSFDDMRVEVAGAEVRIVFVADSEAQARRIGKQVAAKVKAARREEKMALQGGIMRCVKWPDELRTANNDEEG